ncbi:uncharacterized protein PAC_04601 [Phialocephala subalpina]|uniref:F-box domain-containing protein n=1 Tax=Phialocephala subalpina TaxID=576137 RepID=A0A1L7WPL3_9HELO|nr:uncharacterized protein PAC_04601 [Phialocephala subalpina]
MSKTSTTPPCTDALEHDCKALVKMNGQSEDKKEDHRPRVPQQSSFIKFPTELHIMIFDLLGPATQRILGATSSSMYEIYKERYWEKDIIVSYNDDELQDYVKRRSFGICWTAEYTDIIAGWLIHPFFYYDLWRRRAELSELAHKLNIRTQIAEELELEGLFEMLPGWSAEKQNIRVESYGGGFLEH